MTVSVTRAKTALGIVRGRLDEIAHLPPGKIETRVNTLVGAVDDLARVVLMLLEATDRG